VSWRSLFFSAYLIHIVLGQIAEKCPIQLSTTVRAVVARWKKKPKVNST
jgi:hypothetical protein